MFTDSSFAPKPCTQYSISTGLTVTHCFMIKFSISYFGYFESVGPLLRASTLADV